MERGEAYQSSQPHKVWLPENEGASRSQRHHACEPNGVVGWVQKELMSDPASTVARRGPKGGDI